MKVISKLVAGLVLTFSATVSANAAVLSFEDVPGGSILGGAGDMPDGAGGGFYQGYAFSSTLYWVDTGSAGTSWPYGSVSGNFSILNNFGGVGSVTAEGGSDFVFDGLWAKKWATAPESGGAASLFGTLEGWRDGVRVWMVSTALNGSYQYFGAQAGAINQLRLDFGDVFLVDDLALSAAAGPSPVPLPAGLPLLAGGLLAFGALRRRAPRGQAGPAV